MRINRLELKNYRCFENLNLEFDDLMTVVVGNNGAGKTSVLEALAVSLGTIFSGFDGIPDISIERKDARLVSYEMGEGQDVQSQFPVEVIAEGEFAGKNIQWKRSLEGNNGRTTKKDAGKLIQEVKEYQRRLREGDRELTLPILAYYGTGRLWDSHRKKQDDVFKTSTKTNGYIDCLNGTANVKLMMDWFRKKTIQMAGKDANALNSFLILPVVYHAMKICFERSTGYKDISIEYNLDTNELDCYYTVEGSGGKMRMPLSQMSDGYKGTISLVADIAYRMAVLNPQLGTAVIERTDGVVLIDEVDLHLHPTWQHHVLEDLRTIFPKVQFIVTTHAPAVISSAKSDNLVVLSGFNVTDAMTESFGNDANSILTDIMGAAERNPVVAEKFKHFYDLLNTGKYDEAEAVLDDIDVDRSYHDKTVVVERVKLKLERIRGGKNG